MSMFGAAADFVIVDDVMTPEPMTEELRKKLLSWYKPKGGNVYEIKTEETFERTYTYDPGNTLLGMDDPKTTDKLVRKAATENPELLTSSEARPTGKTEEHIVSIWRDGVRIYPRKERENA